MGNALRRLLEILSFGSPQAIVFNISSIFILLSSLPTQSLVYSPVKCVFKHVILPLIFNGSCPIDGFFAECNCPACGMTRGMSRFLHGDIEGALAFNRLVPLVFIAMIVVLILNMLKVYKFYKINKKIW